MCPIRFDRKTDGKRRRWSWERLIWRRHADVWRASGESISRGRRGRGRRKVKMMLHLVIRSRDCARSGSKSFSETCKTSAY